jgi:ABC-type transport system involved in multi-copper enzyme maturation permease subunit
MFNFYHIAKNTFREALREPIFYILMIFSLSLIGLFPTLSMFVFREQTKLVIDSSMATTMVFGLAAAVLCAGHTVSRELRNGTALTLLSKPVRRSVFISSKIAGVICALTVFVAVCDTASLISVRIAKDQFQLDFTVLYMYYGLLFLCSAFGAVMNCMRRVSFASNATGALFIALPVFALAVNFLPSNEGPMPLRLDIVPALVLILLAVWVMGAVTVVFSTRLDMAPNFFMCLVIFFAGLVSNYYLGGRAEGSVFFSLLYALIPNWQFFWMADALASNQQIPAAYIVFAGLYSVIYIVLCGLWASWLFSGREAAKDSVS